MKKRSLFVSLILGLMLLLGNCLPAQADGIIVPPPPPCQPGETCPLPMAQLAVRYHHVTVKIDNQLAVTHVDQVFYNPNDWQVEGTYIFPIPADATVSNFILWVDGKAVEGKVLDAKQAEQTYTQIVSSMKDPALLEYIGRGAVQARIFPIPPKGERRIELEYSQVLTAENGLVKYLYPLNTEKFSALPLETVSIKVEIKSDQPIRAVYSPTHNVDVQQKGDMNHVTASYEDANITPNSDFGLYYSIGTGEAFHLFTYRDPYDPQDKDGFFLLLMAPKPEINAEPIAKDVLLVLDRSGSMEGEKFQQAQTALKYILGHLNSKDRFFVMSFSTMPRVYADGLRPAREAAEAVKWVDRQGASGSTDINRALIETLSIANPERPTYLIFLTDGLPTEGEVNSQKILANIHSAARNNIRLFCFGVGYDVDTILLDSLSQEHHGLSTYVQPGQAIDEILSSFYSRISTPVLTNLELDFGEIKVYDLYPDPLPDLFEGSQVVAVGRYREGGVTNIDLSGDVNGETQTFRFSEQKFSKDSRADAEALSELPRLWATRKIGNLLNKIRLEGADQETIDQIVKLSIRYGIVTPYTSYLVTEPMPLGAENQSQLAEQTYRDMQAQPTAAPSGADAVQKAAAEGALSQSNAAPAVPAEAGERVRTVGSRTFVFQQGVWMDTAYDPQKMQTQKVVFLSDAYFKLAGTRPDIAAALALGERVILVVDGKAYESITDSSGASSRIELPVEITPNDQPDTGTQVVQVITQSVPDVTPEPGGGATAKITPTPKPGGQEPAVQIGDWSLVGGIGLALAIIAAGILILRKAKP